MSAQARGVQLGALSILLSACAILLLIVPDGELRAVALLSAAVGAVLAGIAYLSDRANPERSPFVLAAGLGSLAAIGSSALFLTGY